MFKKNSVPEWAMAAAPELSIDIDSIPLGIGRDPETDEITTIRNPDGNWALFERDTNGHVLVVRLSSGFWQEFTRDRHGNVLRYRNSIGFWSEAVRLNDGREIRYRDAMGTVREGMPAEEAA